VKKLLIAVLALAAVAAAGFALFRDPLIERAMHRVALRALSGEAFTELAGGLNVVVCGSGTPMPDPARAGPCIAVIAGERILIVDAGSGSPRRLAPGSIPAGRISDVLITHFHSDHIDGLGELMMQRWVGEAATSPVPVHGPAGVELVVAGFNQAYAQDFLYRTAHHGEKLAPPSGAGGRAVPFALPPPGQGHVVIDEGGLKVTAFAVDHEPISPAVGYRFDYQGRSVVVSGDTAKSANLQQFAAGADVLLHEALNRELLAIVERAAHEAGNANVEQIMKDITNYHATPVEAGEVAQAAGVKQLVFYHLVPALPVKPLERRFVAGVRDVYDGGITVARDGTWISLPAGSDAVRVGKRF
jgi:ribonuclease Z